LAFSQKSKINSLSLAVAEYLEDSAFLIVDLKRREISLQSYEVPNIGPDNRIRLLESVVRSASHPTAQLRQSPVSLPHLTKVTLFRAEERLSYRKRSPVRCRRVDLHESPLFRATV
jgi:hypothetical protein